MQQQTLFTQPPPRISSHQGQQQNLAFAQPPPRFSSNQGQLFNKNNSFFYNYNNNNNSVNSSDPPLPFKHYQTIPRHTTSHHNPQFTRKRQFTRNANYQPKPMFHSQPQLQRLPPPPLRSPTLVYNPNLPPLQLPSQATSVNSNSLPTSPTPNLTQSQIDLIAIASKFLTTFPQ